MSKIVKKNIFISIGIIILIGGVILSFSFTSYCQLKNASKQLVAAIENNDNQQVKNIIEQYPESVNVLPSMSPRWWQLMSEQPAVSYPLQEACYWGRYDIVKLLIENGADCNLAWKGIEGSKSPLMCAVIGGGESAKDIVEILLEHGANKTYKDERGRTAYDYAIEKDNFELMELLKP